MVDNLIKSVKLTIPDLQTEDDAKSEPAENIQFKEDKLTLVFSSNGRLVKQATFDKLFTKKEEKENKKRTFAQMERNSTEERPQQMANKKPKLTSNKVSSNSSNVDPHRKVYFAWSEKKLEEEISKLESSIREVEEEEEKAVKTAHEINKFAELYRKWLKISHEAVYAILELVPQNQITYEKNTVKTLLDNFKVDYELILYDEENDEFKTDT